MSAAAGHRAGPPRSHNSRTLTRRLPAAPRPLTYLLWPTRLRSARRPVPTDPAPTTPTAPPNTPTPHAPPLPGHAHRNAPPPPATPLLVPRPPRHSRDPTPPSPARGEHPEFESRGRQGKPRPPSVVQGQGQPPKDGRARGGAPEPPWGGGRGSLVLQPPPSLRGLPPPRAFPTDGGGDPRKTPRGDDAHAHQRPQPCPGGGEALLGTATPPPAANKAKLAPRSRARAVFGGGWGPRRGAALVTQARARGQAGTYFPRKSDSAALPAGRPSRRGGLGTEPRDVRPRVRARAGPAAPPGGHSGSRGRRAPGVSGPQQPGQAPRAPASRSAGRGRADSPRREHQGHPRATPTGWHSPASLRKAEGRRGSAPGAPSGTCSGHSAVLRWGLVANLPRRVLIFPF